MPGIVADPDEPGLAGRGGPAAGEHHRGLTALALPTRREVRRPGQPRRGPTMDLVFTVGNGCEYLNVADPRNCQANPP